MVSGYHPLTDSKWVDSVAAEATQELLLALNNDRLPAGKQFAPADIKLINDNAPFIGRAMRGFVVEYLRQTRERIPDFNVRSDIEEGAPVPESGAGLYHAAACTKGLVDRGLSLEVSCRIMGWCVRHSINTYTDRFLEHDELQQYRAPMASVIYRADEIQAHIKSLAQSGMEDKTKLR